MDTFLMIALLVVTVLFVVNLVGVFRDLVSSEYSVLKHTAMTCAAYKCAYYKLEGDRDSVAENAICVRGVSDFEIRYRGNKACHNSIKYFGETPIETLKLAKQMRVSLFSSLNSVAIYISLMLVIYKLISGE